MDDLLLWEVAEFLGVALPPEPVSGQVPSGGGLPGTTAPRSSGRDWAAERVRYAQGLGPKPETDAPDPAMLEFAMQFQNSL